MQQDPSSCDAPQHVHVLTDEYSVVIITSLNETESIFTLFLISICGSVTNEHFLV